MLSRRQLPAGIAVVMALFAFPAAGSAATRYAAPDGSLLTLCDTPANACRIDRALTVAGATADEVVVEPGDYDVTATPLTVGAASNVHGVDGQPRPVIHGAVVGAPLISLIGPGATLRHLAIRQDGSGGAGGVSVAVNATTTASLADLVLRNTVNEGTPARLGTGVVMSGTTALATGTPGSAVDVTGTAVSLHNVTAWATGAGASGIEAEPGSLLTATNTIARAPAGTDVAGLGATMTASNYGGAPAPLLTDPAGGDFHQLAGSPTIDAGLVDPLAGLTDPDGDARILGATQDIGADEYISHRPMAATGDAAGTTVTGSVTPNGIPTSYRFEYGPTPLYGSATPSGDAGAGGGAVPVSSALSGLTAGSIVHYRVVASNADGETAGLDRVLVAPGTLTATQLAAPHFSSLSAPTTATVGQPITIRAAGSDRNDPVNSIAIDFDDGPGFFAESACRLRPRNRAFRDGRRSSFSVPYTFSNPGTHTVEVTLGSGSCGRRGQTTTQTIQVNVLPKPKHLARVRARDERVIAAADCPNADVLPAPGNTKAIESSTLCLLNQMRRQYRLKPFRRNKKLRRAAALHNGYMLRGQFLSHQGPGEPPLGARFHKVRYRGGGGENIGVGAGMPYATPRSMVLAWMGSPVHRANILERAFFTIGIAVAPAKPIPPPPVPGATYTTEFGTTRR